MGTNFYAIIKFGERRAKKLMDYSKAMETAIESDNAIKFGDCFDDLNFEWQEIKKECIIHLGKRSFGWAFCWDLNDMKYYKPTLASIREFLYNMDGYIIDEEKRIYTTDEFLNAIRPCMYVSDKPMTLKEVNESNLYDAQKQYIIEEYINKNIPYYRYCTSKTYYLMHPNERKCTWYSERNLNKYVKYAKEVIIPSDSDFVSKDNLRCALYTDFS